jgi:hypothetical protein
MIMEADDDAPLKKCRLLLLLLIRREVLTTMVLVNIMPRIISKLLEDAAMRKLASNARLLGSCKRQVFGCLARTTQELVRDMARFILPKRHNRS